MGIHGIALVLTLAGTFAAGAAEPITARISGERVRLRQGPSTNDAIMVELNTGDAVAVMATPEDKAPWVQVRVPVSGVTGWVHGEYLRLGVTPTTAPKGYTTGILLCTTPDLAHLAWHGHGIIVAQVRFVEEDAGLLRCTITDMQRVWQNAGKTAWGERQPISRIPFTDENDLEWRDVDGGAWQAGDTFLATPASLWRRAAQIPDTPEAQRNQALLDLGAALGAMGKAYWTGKEWQVAEPAGAAAPGAGYTRVGQPGREVFKAKPQP